MTTNRMGLEQSLSDERLEQYANDKRMCNVNDEIREMARELLAYRKANKPVMFIDGDISPNDAEKLAAAIREFNSEPSDSVCMAESFPPLQAVTVPDGWQLVPIEPTYEMSKAIGLPWEQPPFPLRWKRMLEAAPKAGSNG